MTTVTLPSGKSFTRLGTKSLVIVKPSHKFLTIQERERKAPVRRVSFVESTLAMFRAPRGRHRREGGAILLMLLARIYQAYEASPVKPPVTFGLVGLLVGAHFAPFGKLDDICLTPRAMSLRRAIFSSLTPADDYHLYYHVGSLLAKGVLMERKFGSELFPAFVVSSFVPSAAIYPFF